MVQIDSSCPTSCVSIHIAVRKRRHQPFIIGYSASRKSSTALLHAMVANVSAEGAQSRGGNEASKLLENDQSKGTLDEESY